MQETPGHQKPTVTFFFRKPRPEYHSIENLFRQVLGGLRLQRPEWTIETAVCPQSRITPQTLWRNTWFAHRKRGVVNHITGDVHYIALGCGAGQTVLTIHDCVILSRNQHRPLRFMFFRLLWYYLPIRRAAVVTTISEKTRQELYQYVGSLADKVIVIPNGYDPAFTFNPRPFNLEKPTLLHIGTAPHKNLSKLVEAIEGLPCRLVIVGELTSVEKENLGNCRIDYRQYVNVSQEQIIELYGQCDIVTFVSL